MSRFYFRRSVRGTIDSRIFAPVGRLRLSLISLETITSIAVAAIVSSPNDASVERVEGNLGARP